MERKRTFYVLDFLKNFFKWHNVPMMIYLIVNLLFIYLGTMMLTQLYISFFAGDHSLPISLTSTEYYVITAAVIAGVYFIALVLSLSPIGEWILRKKLHCNIIEDTDIQNRIIPIFDEVYSAALRESSSVSDHVRIFIQASDDPNAFAVGRRTVCITTALLAYSDEEIKGVLAHEFGHLAHKDTDLCLVVNIANWLTNIIFLGVWALLFLIRLMMKLLTVVVALLGENIAALASSLVEIIFTAFAFLCVTLFQKLWLIVGNLLLLATSRGNEYKADEFALRLGYQDGLLGFFYTLPDAVEGHRNTFKKILEAIATVGATHPATWKRIAAIKKLSNARIAVY